MMTVSSETVSIQKSDKEVSEMSSVKTKATATKTTSAKTSGKKPAAGSAGKSAAVVPARVPLVPDDITVGNYKYDAAYFTPERRAEVKACTDLIQKALDRIDGGLETIAFTLYKVHTSELYRSDGTYNVCEYAAKHFGYGKTTVYSFLSVVDRFALRDADGMVVDGKLDPLVKGYSFSKLSLMTSLTDAQIKKDLIPSRTVREIKKYVKEYRADTPAAVEEKPRAGIPADGNAADAKPVEPADGTKVSERPENPSAPASAARNFKSLDDYRDGLDALDDMFEDFIRAHPGLKFRISISTVE